MPSASEVLPTADELYPACEDSPTISYPFYSPPPPPPPLHPDPYSSTYTRCSQPPPLTEVTQHVSLPYSPVVYAPVMMGTSPQQQVGTNAFWLTFVKGNISRCAGCGQRTLRGEDGKPRLPPHNLCLQHKEHVLFENPYTGGHQLSAELRNMYYHAQQHCVLLKHKDFNAGND